jgi:energy-converting hydrogenase B subunit Q
MIQPPMSAHAILCSLADRPGMLSALTKVLADHQANITYVDIHPGKPAVGIYFEFTVPDDPPTGSGSPRAQSRGDRFAATVADLRAVAGVEEVNETPSFAKIYGKRIIVMGGGAQVGQVAMGAITEADRHNIRGERISVDTIPLVGEQELAAAVRATGRLPRVKMLVLAGALMGGDIATAVEEVRASGLPVISLNMAGSVPDAADLVVSDPVQAGVMAVMAVADTAKFDLMRQLKRRY